MITKIGRKNYKLYAMDIESHNDPWSVKHKVTSCWLGCFIDDKSTVDDPSSYFYSMEEFIQLMEEKSRIVRSKNRTRQCANLAIYIFNLSFEWSFLLPKLLEAGFTFNEDPENNDFTFSSVTTKSVSSVWEVILKFGKNHGIIRLRDLAKIFSGSLRKVAKSFGLSTQKGEIDYTLDRRINHVVTQEEKQYCFNDTRIIIEILAEMIKREDSDFFKSISAASYSMYKLMKVGFGNTYRPYTRFRELYPVLNKEETEFLRRGVEGGICYPAKDWQFKIIDQKILHIDMHQAHPTSAFLNVFPYGEGEYFKGKPKPDKICACRIKISYDDVRLHSIIKLIGLDFVEDFEIVVWDFEIPTMKKCYVNLKIKYVDGFSYKTRFLPWRQYYRRNYLLRKKAKEEGDLFNIQYYKLLNNSSYGKLLEKPHNTIIQNCINDDGVIDSIVIDKPEEDCKLAAKYTYLPVGSAIPAYTRVRLVETALKFGWEKVIYFDTDSIFCIYDEDSERVWNTIDQTDFLGGWGLEEIDDRGQFLAAKRYKLEVENEVIVKAGGINFDKYLKDNQITEFDFDEVNLTDSSWLVSRAFRVKGGTIIDYQKKELTVLPKYQEIYKKNVSK